MTNGYVVAHQMDHGNDDYTTVCDLLPALARMSVEGLLRVTVDIEDMSREFHTTSNGGIQHIVKRERWPLP